MPTGHFFNIWSSYLRHPGIKPWYPGRSGPEAAGPHRHPYHPDLRKAPHLHDRERDGKDGKDQKGLKSFIADY